MNILLGACVLVLCVIIQCIVVAVLVRWHFLLRAMATFRVNILSFSTVLSVVALILSAGTFLQAGAWAWLFVVLDEFPDFHAAYYHSIVNFTTLGYGDLVMSEEHRILGGLEAANGILMLGLSTSVLYTALKFMINRGWHGLDAEEQD